MLVRPSTSDDSLITPSLHAKMRVFFEGVDSDAEVQVLPHLYSTNTSSPPCKNTTRTRPPVSPISTGNTKY